MPGAPSSPQHQHQAARRRLTPSDVMSSSSSPPMRPREEQYLLPVDFDADDDDNGFLPAAATPPTLWPRVATRRTFVVFLAMLSGLLLLVVVVKMNEAGTASRDLAALLDAAADAMRAAMDPAADPCTDFYRYACGAWLANATVPDDKASVSRSFTALDDRNRQVLLAIAVSSRGDAGAARIDALYRSCMDVALIDQVGMAPLHALLARLDDVRALDDLLEVVGAMEQSQPGIFFDVSVGVDDRNTSRHLVVVGQAGLAMGARHWYTSHDARYVGALREHIRRLFADTQTTPFQGPDLDAAADALVAFEAGVAAFTSAPDDLRDPVATYNLRSADALPIDLTAYLAALGVPARALAALNVVSPGFVQGMARLLRGTPLAVLKDYVAFRTVHAYANVLPQSVRDETFRFFQGVLRGAQAREPRWKQCVARLDAYLGDDIGRRFLAAAGFTDSDRRRAIAMVDDVTAQFYAMLDESSSSSWLSRRARRRAQRKLKNMKVLMGYPLTWTNYDALDLHADDPFGNVRRARAFLWRDDLDRLMRPVDPHRFAMTTPTVNAYYDPTLNSINFPAGILAPPFFSLAFPSALNWGALGTIIGHELVHAFDDQGRQYDETGALHDWWPEQDVARFNDRAACIEEQYQRAFTYAEGEFNTKLTLGENIADNVGVAVAYRAWQQLQEDDADEDLSSSSSSTRRLLEEVPSSQLFFIAMAQNWCRKMRPEAELDALQTDPHGPSDARVNGPLMNSDGFAAAFQCPVGSRLNPAKKCRIW
ncbi:Peptidase M13 C-terminal domain-containing protein [Plasmodiophora brassicae]